nr:MAG: maturation protein [Sanya fiers-like virus 7]
MTTLFYQDYQKFPATLSRAPVLAKLLAQARSNQWNVPVFIAELGKTSEMVYTRALQLVGLVRDLRRGDFASFVRGLHPDSRYGRSKIRKYEDTFRKQWLTSPRQAASNALLEFQYGWVPMAMDIQSAVATLSDIAEEAREGRDRGVLTVRAYDAVQEVTTASQDIGVTPDVGATFTDQKKQSFKAVWHFTVNPLDIPSRLGLINLLEAGWELTTLSFVVDWALPIGDYLAGFGDNLRFSHRGGSLGYKATWNQVIRDWTSSDYSRVTGPAQSGSSTWGYREPFGGVPAITAIDVLTAAQANLSPRRAAAAMALLSQAFDALKRR